MHSDGRALTVANRLKADIRERPLSENSARMSRWR